MSVLILVLTAVWAIAGVVGTLAWWRNLQNSRRRIKNQIASGENGSLRAIALASRDKDYVGLLSCLAVVLAAVGRMTLPDNDVRAVIVILLVVGVAVGVAYIGIRKKHWDEAIESALRKELAGGD